MFTNKMVYSAVIACALGMASIVTKAANVDVTVYNNTPKHIRWSSSGWTQLPTVLAPGASTTIRILTPFGSSDIRAKYASGQVLGGCEFQAGHTEYKTGPKYTSSAVGYGQVYGFCQVYLTKKWTPPYDYQVKFVISQ